MNKRFLLIGTTVLTVLIWQANAISQDHDDHKGHDHGKHEEKGKEEKVGADDHSGHDEDDDHKGHDHGKHDEKKNLIMNMTIQSMRERKMKIIPWR